MSASADQGPDATIGLGTPALGAPTVEGDIRQRPEDFRVDEVLAFEPDGDGPHAWLRIRKRNRNSLDVAGLLARVCGVRSVAVGYAGLKDRVAVTTQWFSVDVGSAREPDWADLASPDVQVLEITRHRRKLRRGGLAHNRFSLTVRNLAGPRESLTDRLEQVRLSGVPNGFGPQRFGRGGSNLAAAAALFEGGRPIRSRSRRGLVLSAARSLLFNRVLGERVARGCWSQVLAGDVMMLDGSHSIFPVAEPDESIRRRVAEMDLHPTGPLWGRGPLATNLGARQLEESALAGDGGFCRGLEAAGLKQDRRALRVAVPTLQWSLTADCLELGFDLPPGAYATALLREVVHAHDASARED